MIDHILNASFEKGLIITIIYAKNNAITKRNIRVLELNGSCIKAYCHLRQQNRIFRRENILAADYCREKTRL